MPIYVNGSEAGKLYVMANPPLQIGKVYRKDAGGSSLIYSAETVLQNLLTEAVSSDRHIDAGYSDYDREMATYAVEVGHKYYIRAVSSRYGSFTWGGTTQVRYNGTVLTDNNTNHTIWTANTDTLKITHRYTGQCAAGHSVGCRASLYMVVDVTDLDASVAGNANTFWQSIGADVFYGSKAFDF